MMKATKIFADKDTLKINSHSYFATYNLEEFRDIYKSIRDNYSANASVNSRLDDIFVLAVTSKFEFLRRNEKNAKHASRSELSPNKD